MNKQLGTMALSGVVVGRSEDAAEPDSGNAMERILRSLQYFSTAAEGLRFLGAAVLLASMSVFLLQGWNDGNDIRRYLLLLSQTGLLTACGFALIYGLKETKGARIFFGLALVSVPANFTILSALLYSVFQWDGALGTYPEFATWRIGDLASTSMTLAGAMLVLIPVALFCFSIMARRSAKMLSLHFLLLNSLLLLPIRSSATVGMVALIATVYALYVGARLTRADRNLKTPEGKFALTTLFIPIGIILFRSMYFYEVDALLVAMLSITVFLIARQTSVFPGRDPRVANTLDVMSLAIALVIAVSLTAALDNVISTEFLALIFTGSFAFFAIDIIRRTRSRIVSATGSVAISVLTCAVLVSSVAFIPSLTTAVICLLGAAILGMVGHVLKDRLAFAAAGIMAIAAVFFGFGEFARAIMGSSWVDLAIFGASAIALGSLLDRHGASFKVRLSKWLNG